MPRWRVVTRTTDDGSRAAPTTTAADGTVVVTRQAWLALAISGIGQVLWAFNLTATNIAFDQIDADFPEGTATVGLVASGFFVGSASLLLVAGRFADRIGRRRIFNSGLVLFAVAAVGSAVAPNIWILIATRIIASAGAAFVIPAGLAMILPLFPRERHGTAVGAWSLSGPIAGMIAPAGTAIVLGISSWRVVYFLTAPLALAALAAGAFVLRESKAEREPGPLDIPGAVVGTTLVGTLVIVVGQGNEHRMDQPVDPGEHRRGDRPRAALRLSMQPTSRAVVELDAVLEWFGLDTEPRQRVHGLSWARLRG